MTHLRIMAISFKVTLPNLLPMVIRLLIHPSLACVGQTTVGLRPVEIFALVWAVISIAVVETRIGVCELLGVSCGIGSKAVVPNKVRTTSATGLGDGLAGYDGLVSFQIFSRKVGEQGEGQIRMKKDETASIEQRFQTNRTLNKVRTPRV